MTQTDPRGPIDVFSDMLKAAALREYSRRQRDVAEHFFRHLYYLLHAEQVEREAPGDGMGFARWPVVFHPRGFALGLHHDHAGNPHGWSLLGDGTEVWAFESDEDAKFEAAQAFLRQHTKPIDDEPPSPPDAGKLCCCHTGTDCPACLTGRCHECPDNPERERDDEDEDWQDDDD